MTANTIHVATSRPQTVAGHPALPAAVAFLIGIGVHSLLPHVAAVWLDAATGMLLLTAMARRRGLAADYLGSDVPVEDWVSASSDPAVAAAVLALPTADEVQATAEVIEALRRHRPDLVIAAGGPEEGRAPDGVTPLGDDLFDAVRVLADMVATPESSRG